MKHRVRYATLMTIAIMALFYAASVLITRAFLSVEKLDLTTFALVLGLLQISLGVLILRLMKRDGSYLPDEHGLSLERSLFTAKFMWLFILLKFAAVFVMLDGLRELGGLRTPRWYEFVLVIAFAFTVGFFEEYLFRGFLFKNYLLALGHEKVVGAALVSALIFGMVHLDPTSLNAGMVLLQLPGAIVAGGVGFYLAATYYKTGKIFHVILLHTLFNLSTFLLAPFLSLDLLDTFPALSVLPIDSGLGTFLPNIVLAVLFFFFGYRMLKKTQAEKLRIQAHELALEELRRKEAEQAGVVSVVDLNPDMGNSEQETALRKEESCLD